jgi:hypothetical protein
MGTLAAFNCQECPCSATSINNGKDALFMLGNDERICIAPCLAFPTMTSFICFCSALLKVYTKVPGATKDRTTGFFLLVEYKTRGRFFLRSDPLFNRLAKGQPLEAL